MAKLMNWVGPVVPVSPSPVARTTGAVLAVGERDWLLAWILMPCYSSFSLIFRRRDYLESCTLEVMTESFTVFAGKISFVRWRRLSSFTYHYRQSMIRGPWKAKRRIARAFPAQSAV